MQTRISFNSEAPPATILPIPVLDQTDATLREDHPAKPDSSPESSGLISPIFFLVSEPALGITY